MYRVFYAIPATYTHYQDTLQRFSSLDRAVEAARKHMVARVTDQNGIVYAIIDNRSAQ